MTALRTAHDAHTAAAPLPAASAELRRLYLIRFGFAAVWAALLFATASALNPLNMTLLVLYPLFDLGAALVDLRGAREGRGAAVGLYANVVLSAATAVGLAFAVTSGIPAVLRVWGLWAVTAGAVQLLVGAARRRLGGQWPMIASGAISTFAGTSFVVQAGSGNASLSNLAGYAFLGGVFFLGSALRLKRAPQQA
ncbi:hypothetical protein ABZ439_13665 [Streptomyces sp. NPDC005840]|uniref:hypothetical protein n=1 Tax=unclassified Streptomyces TaxID=2593676 RepID=UPI0033349965